MSVDDHQGYQHLEAVISLMARPALLLGPDANVVTVNSAFVTRIGKGRSSLVGEAFQASLPRLQQGSFATFVALCAKGDTAQTFSAAFRSDAVALDLVLSPIWVDGRITGYLGQEDMIANTGDLRLKYLMEDGEQGVWDYDTRTRRFVVSNAWRKMRGIRADVPINDDDGAWLARIHPDDREELQQVFYGATRGEATSIDIQYRHRHRDGRWVWIMCHAKIMAWDDRGKPARILGTDTDISQLRENEKDLVHTAEQLRLAIDASGIGVWEFDPNTGTVHWDDTMLEIYGLTDGQNDRSGTSWENHLHPDDLAETVAYSEHCQANGLDFSRDYRIVRPDGSVRYVRSRASLVAVPGQQPKLFGVNFDMTEDHLRAQELEKAKAQLLYDSRHDALTGLANRRLLDETTKVLFSQVRPNHRYAVLHLDLDHFKEVNDTLGHAAGDAVLMSVARRLRRIIGDSGLVCRTGGDEFAILFEDAASIDTLDDVCRSIVEAISTPITFEGHLCKIGVSIGCALGRGPTDDHADIFLKADTALYAAKSAGRNCYRMSTDAVTLSDQVACG